MKVEKMDRRSSFGNMVRKKFSNITNSLPQPKPPVISEKSPLDSASAKEYIDHLVKEKMVLAKIVHEKNKVLELSGIEIQKLRTSLLMMRLHNWNLAQSNSQMLTELSLGREKLKAQQHDLVCKEALLKAKDLELKESETVGRENEFRKHRKSYNANRSMSSKSTQSLGGSPLSQPHAGHKQAVGSNRRCPRRRSASSGIQHEEPADILYDIDYNSQHHVSYRYYAIK
ncbi:SHUGOSHIN 1-like [Primulina eburnea]|uniref:SHUGOSHIN 1-like n=1 Tax=Primulina eburnea TaxID=1245227 RepID=UPI003C6C535A